MVQRMKQAKTKVKMSMKIRTNLRIQRMSETNEEGSEDEEGENDDENDQNIIYTTRSGRTCLTWRARSLYY